MNVLVIALGGARLVAAGGSGSYLSGSADSAPPPAYYKNNSYPVNATLCAQCDMGGSDLPGNQTVTSTYDGCARKCGNNPACLAWAWDSQTHGCFPKAARRKPAFDAPEFYGGCSPSYPTQLCLSGQQFDNHEAGGAILSFDRRDPASLQRWPVLTPVATGVASVGAAGECVGGLSLGLTTGSLTLRELWLDGDLLAMDVELDVNKTASFCTADAGMPDDGMPFGVHLTLTGVPTEMAVSWGVPGNITGARARVRYGSSADALFHTALNGSTTTMVSDTEDLATYSYCGDKWVTHTLFMVLLSSLPPNSTIFYAVDILNAQGKVIVGGLRPVVSSFRTQPLEPKDTLRFLATADVGDPVSHPWTALPQVICTPCMTDIYLNF